MIWPFTKLKEQKKQIDHLQSLLIKRETQDITLEDLRGNSEELSMTLSGSSMHLFADAFGQQFVESGAKNFLSMEFYHEGTAEKYEVTMQKVSGETVCEQLNRLRGSLTRSADTIDYLVKEGLVSHHSQVELDALTDGMRTTAKA